MLSADAMIIADLRCYMNVLTLCPEAKFAMRQAYFIENFGSPGQRSATPSHMTCGELDDCHPARARCLSSHNNKHVVMFVVIASSFQVASGLRRYCIVIVIRHRTDDWRV
jgi:hypothetical protein